jgi:hypothetical protein
MKWLMSSVLFSVASGLAFAEVKSPIQALRFAKYDGKTLEVGYRIGGGCQEHTAKVEVTAQRTSAGPIAEVAVFDVSPDLDGCEALLYKEAKVDLRQLVVEAVKAMGEKEVDWKTITVKLPYILSEPR